MEAVQAGVKEGFADMEAFIAEISGDPLVSGKIFGTREFLTESAAKNYGLEKSGHAPLCGRAHGTVRQLRGRGGLPDVSSPMPMGSRWMPRHTATP